MHHAEQVEKITIDGFLDSKFEVYQNNDGGHRAGLDALLLAALVPADAKGSLVDLGAGTGVAGLAALATASGLKSCQFVEFNPMVAALLERTTLELNDAKFAGNTSVLEADVSAIAEGLEELSFEDLTYGRKDFVITNPPFNSDAYRPSPNADRAKAHQVNEVSLSVWIKAGHRFLKSGGTFGLIFRPEDLGDCLSALGANFGAVQILPIAARNDEPAKRVLVKAIKGRKTALSLLAPFVLHEDDGAFTKQADAIFRGEMKLPF